MDNARADKLISLLEQLVEVLKPEPLPTLEQAVEARVKTIYMDRGIAEVFDKLDSHDSVRNLINRRSAEVASKTMDAIEKLGDAEFKTQRQKEIEAAVKKAVEEKTMEVNNE